MPRHFGCVALAFVVCACADRTQLILVVDSDLAPRDELDEVRVMVRGPSGESEEAAQSLGEPDAPPLPLTLGVRPGGEALGPVEIRAEGRHDGQVVVTRTAITSLVRGEVRVLTLFLARACRGVACPTGETCTETGCASAEIDADDLPRWTGEVPRRDAGSHDAGAASCTNASECDDGTGCTVGECIDGRCRHTSLCAQGEMCCAGACVPAGCDDDNPCTDDACGPSGCEHVNHDGPCDDGLFCNGADTCRDGACSVHAGAPCSGSVVCDEAADVCTGCLADEDCGSPVYGPWGECGGFAGDCGETGTQSRSVTTYSCMSGTCVPSTSSESQPCERDTDGRSCGTTTCGSFGDCGGFSPTDVCDESGTQTRTCHDRVCAEGACITVMRTEEQPCERDTDGTMCAPTQCTPGLCTGFTNACDRTGTEMRTCTDYRCTSGSCNAGAPYTSSIPCLRNTDGNPCDDGLWCTDGDTCFGEWCTGHDICSGSCECTSLGCQDLRNPGLLCPIE